MTLQRDLIALAALLLLGGGCSSAGAPTPTPSPSGGMTAAEMEAIYRARIDSARTRYTEADVRFMTDMIHHHAQAIEMARRAPAQAGSASIRTLAARIINAQEDEIATMQDWLRARNEPVPELHMAGEPVMVHGEHDASMPGMLTPAQLQQLARVRGAEFDRLFLTLMIQHHRGAVTMVHRLFATDGAGQDEDVFRFASDVQVDQATEVARMELMLSALSNESRLR
jgi:uncharacterized protein (DUF305 family)